MKKPTKTLYLIQIRTQPHTGWTTIDGWGPYETRDEAAAACARADKLWMAARTVPFESDELRTDEGAS